MPRLSKLSGSKAISDVSIASVSLFDLLVPNVRAPGSRLQQQILPTKATQSHGARQARDRYTESLFYSALAQVSLCSTHQRNTTPRFTIFQRSGRGPEKCEFKQTCPNKHRRSSERPFSGRLLPNLKHRKQRWQDEYLGTDLLPHSLVCQISAYQDGRNHTVQACERAERDRCGCSSSDSSPRESADAANTLLFMKHNAINSSVGDEPLRIKNRCRCTHHSPGPFLDYTGRTQKACSGHLWSDIKTDSKHTEKDLHRRGLYSNNKLQFSTRPDHSNIRMSATGQRSRMYHTQRMPSRDLKKQGSQKASLPPDFFGEIATPASPQTVSADNEAYQPQRATPDLSMDHCSTDQSWPLITHKSVHDKHTGNSDHMDQQMKLLRSVRELEQKLGTARRELAQSMAGKATRLSTPVEPQLTQPKPPVVLTREDYANLVDLYYYSHNSRFSPESTDGSPTPLVLNDYTFTLSSDFSQGSDQHKSLNEDEGYESPLKQIEEMLKQRQLREIAVMQVFVDLLLDDQSSTRALYEAYKQLPEPGVAYLPRGIIRLFLQRMSTPWTLSEKSMLRYLSLIDDMQTAKISITVSEWSSAVYLAGRAFSRVTDQEVNAAFDIWQNMETEAGVKASHVTFNILFDIAVRSGKFALGETVLKEMHHRNLRLNRLGRVSLMYYHGLRKDGDGVRKAYRDFVEAGEIVDTLVLNCVIASLLNAQEPQAAEQIYARMKNLHGQLRKGHNRDGEESLFRRYPEPGCHTIGHEMASNHLGRVLEKAPRLQRVLPEHHVELQSMMPLTPDHTTFRSMLAYHATVSGDLDRLTVLLNEMTDVFHLPLQSLTFQLLFKGFAIHGPRGGPHSTWSAERLDLCWAACRSAVKDSRQSRSPPTIITSTKAQSSEKKKKKKGESVWDPTLPSITQVNAIPADAGLPEFSPPLSRPPPRRLSDWSEFVLDLAAFPRERLKHLERFHATMFDAEDAVKPHEKPGVHTFQSPFFQSVAYTAPEPRLDKEEGEYELPSPSTSGLVLSGGDDATTTTEVRSLSGHPPAEVPRVDAEEEQGAAHQVAITKTLACWLLRAYTRNTHSRNKVEEVWGQVRKIYKPWDADERESVVRVLRRCLRDCDREGK